MTTTDKGSNPEEVKNVILFQRKQMKQKNARPDWIEYDPEKKKKSVSVAKLGEYVYKQHKEEWLLVRDGKDNEFWTYRYKENKITETSGETVKQKVWQLSSPDTIKAAIHNQLKKYNLWTAKREKDALTYINGELLSNIKDKADTIDKIQPRKILVVDGVLCFDLAGNTHVEPNNPKYFFTDFATFSVQDAPKKASQTDKWFNETFSTSALTLKQFIGYMFFPTYQFFQVYIILLASGGDGKSTTLNFINSLLPPNEVSHISLQALTASEKNSKNFSLAGLRNKRLNTRNDITDDFIQDASMIKTLTGNDPIYASVKFHEDTSFINHAKLMFACNSLPEYRDISKGFTRRAYIITTKGIEGFSKKYNFDEILKERGAFVIECIKAFCTQVKDQKQRTDIKDWQLYRDEQTIVNSHTWSIDNDQVQQFLDEKACLKSETPRNYMRKIDDTYNAYVNWTKQSGVKPLGKYKFNSQLRDKGFKDGRTTVKGETFRYWLGLKLKTDTKDLLKQ